MVSKGPKMLIIYKSMILALSKNSCEFLGYPSPPLQTKSALKCQMSNVKEVLYLTVSLNTTMNDLKLMCCSAMCLFGHICPLSSAMYSAVLYSIAKLALLSALHIFANPTQIIHV